MEVENVEKLNPEETEENNDPGSKLVEDLAIEYSQYMKIDTEAEVMCVQSM